MSDSPMYDMVEAIFDKNRPPTRFLMFPEGGPLSSHVGVPEERIDCEGGYYAVDFSGKHAVGYMWVPDSTTGGTDA